MDFFQFYTQALAKRDYKMDTTQQKVAQHLQALYQNHAWRDTWLARCQHYLPWAGRLLWQILKPRRSSETIKGSVYIWGGVGRGKSFLVDAFFAWLPTKRKKRVHFHAFMRDVHRRLHELSHQSGAIQQVAKECSDGIDWLCFDEFHISDIADAMIFDRLLEALFTTSTHFLTSSNYAPQSLYPNGLNRERFLPAIDRLYQNAHVLSMNEGRDYRLNKKYAQTTFFNAKDARSQDQLIDIFLQHADIPALPETPNHIAIEHRKIDVLYQHPKILWASFKQLCDTPRSNADYLAIARQYPVIILSDVPEMPPNMLMQARRFTWLIDICYDEKILLCITAHVPYTQLYTEGAFVAEFARTVSRLMDMQSQDYQEKTRKNVKNTTEIFMH